MELIKRPEELCLFLESKHVDFQVLKHETATTSKESALLRNSPESAGAKALIVNTKPTGSNMLVLAGNKKLDNKLAKQIMEVKSFRFLTKDELYQATGLKPGEVPPFGNIYGFSTFCDQQLLTNEYIYFNICSHTVSVKLKTLDYLRIEEPNVYDFSV